MKQIKPCNSRNLKPSFADCTENLIPAPKASLSYAMVHRWWFANFIVVVACQNKASIILRATSVGRRPLALIWQNIEVREP